ncbi:hypothetical protein HGK72_30885 [Mycolicibacterium fortuitum]|uniref:hypothetical protein n=1 Tax=Mycolicibacterium fortuitum TaxID=1766 RepID=UPI0014906DF2|nr:hypothetical protein [Mycolicibacterium fortuitum]
MSGLADALVGRYVHFHRQGSAGLELLHQGRIAAAEDDLLLIEVDIAADGGPPVQGLVRLAELCDEGVFLYETAEQMHAGYERFDGGDDD